MRIKMLCDCRGSENGIQVKDFESGKTYDVCDDLGNAFVASNRAETTDEPKADVEVPPNDESTDEPKARSKGKR